MGNNCVHAKISKDGFFSSFWWSRSADMITYEKKESSFQEGLSSVQNSPPELVKIESKPSDVKGTDQVIIIVMDDKKDARVVKPEEMINITVDLKQEKACNAKPRKPHNVKRMASAGLQVDSVLKTKTGHLKEHYNLGEKLGHGQFGTTFLCIEKGTGKKYACKSIAKRKLLTDEDVDDVRREIQIMHHLSGHPNVISIKGAYEDAVAVHVVMELCTGGELFDRIIKRGHYSERQAAELARTILGVVEACHSLGVMHRDLKPENFLFVNEEENSPLKTIDFGLSMFFKPGSCSFPFILFTYIATHIWFPLFLLLLLTHSISFYVKMSD